MLSYPTNVPKYGGLTNTVSTIIQTYSFLSRIDNDNGVAMNPDASVQDRINAYNDLTAKYCQKLCFGSMSPSPDFSPKPRFL